MAIVLNDNIKINAGKPSESKYLNSSNVAYSATTEAVTAIPISERYLGLTVLVDTGTSNIVTTGTVGSGSATLTGTLSTAAQTSVTSLGTLTAVTVDDITIDANAISSAGASTDLSAYLVPMERP